MTNEEIYELYQNGSTYREIADRYGITRQTVAQRLKYYKRKVAGIRGHNFDINKIVYQGIYDWFREHYYESLSSLSKKIYGYYRPCELTKLRSFLIGEHETHFNVEQIKRMCELTGKSFEELFQRRDV